MTQGTSKQDAGHQDWDPNQYLKFADQRFRAAVELLQRVPVASPATVADLGCGTGEVTRLIADHWPSATVVALDSSTTMLDHAKSHSSDIEWTHSSIADWIPQRQFDLIYSNAALHWVPDHDRLLPRLAEYLADGGCLAVQMPLSWQLPSHRLMRETLQDGGEDGGPLGTRQLRDQVAQPPVAHAQFYYDVLAAHVSTLDIWETEYLQVLEGTDPVFEWMSGTGLRPIIQQLDEDERRRFLDIYGQRLRTTYPPIAAGKTLYPFRRLFIVACR